MKNIPEWLYIWIVEALLGEIYPSIRAIAIGFNEDKFLTLRYYIDREVSNYDYENIDLVTTYILANTSSNNQIKSIKEEIFFDLKKSNELERLNGFVYLRKEN